MRENARCEAFSSKWAGPPDHSLLITERNGREITVYMRTELLSEITVANLFIAARMADLLPEHGACLLQAPFARRPACPKREEPISVPSTSAA